MFSNINSTNDTAKRFLLLLSNELWCSDIQILYGCTKLMTYLIFWIRVIYSHNKENSVLWQLLQNLYCYKFQNGEPNTSTEASKVDVQDFSAFFPRWGEKKQLYSLNVCQMTRLIWPKPTSNKSKQWTRVPITRTKPPFNQTSDLDICFDHNPPKQVVSLILIKSSHHNVTN